MIWLIVGLCLSAGALVGALAVGLLSASADADEWAGGLASLRRLEERREAP